MTHQEKSKKIRDAIKSLITKETPVETIELISSIDKDLDDLDNEFEAKNKDYDALKDKFIDVVKSGKTSAKGDRESDIDSKPKTFEEQLSEFMAKKKGN